MHLYLGSSSPACAKILSDAGFTFHIVNPRIDEELVGAGIKSPTMLVQRLVYAKTQAILMRKPKMGVLITTATAVALDGKVIGPPKDEREALSWLLQYWENPPTIHTLVAVTDIAKKKTAVDIDHTCVLFSQISASAIKSALERGTIMQRPGAIDLDDPDLKRYIQSINGDVNSLHGMPVDKVKMLLATLDHPV